MLAIDKMAMAPGLQGHRWHSDCTDSGRLSSKTHSVAVYTVLQDTVSCVAPPEEEEMTGLPGVPANMVHQAGWTCRRAQQGDLRHRIQPSSSGLQKFARCNSSTDRLIGWQQGCALHALCHSPTVTASVKPLQGEVTVLSSLWAATWAPEKQQKSR